MNITINININQHEHQLEKEKEKEHEYDRANLVRGGKKRTVLRRTHAISIGPLDPKGIS